MRHLAFFNASTECNCDLFSNGDALGAFKFSILNDGIDLNGTIQVKTCLDRLESTTVGFNMEIQI